MKTSELKSLLKEALREVIQEELREILLEAVKAPKIAYAPPINEQHYAPSPSSGKPNTPAFTSENNRKAYMDVLNETSNASDINRQKFVPVGSMDMISEGSALPPGEVGMDQILQLMNPNNGI
jgi:hypothetical protein